MSNRTADPKVFINAPGSDAHCVWLCVPSDGRAGGKQRQPSGREEARGEALVGLRLLSSESLLLHKIVPRA